MKQIMYIIFILILVIFAAPIFLVALLGKILFFRLPAYIYTRTKKFETIAKENKIYVDEINDFNEYIKDINKKFKIHFDSAINSAYKNIGNYEDRSRYNFKREFLHSRKIESNIHDCSLSVFSNACNNPFDYFCKYTNAKPNEKTLEAFENILSEYESTFEGLNLLNAKRYQVVSNSEIPWYIRTTSKKYIQKKLGFYPPLKEIISPEFTFRYISPGGNSTQVKKLTFDKTHLNIFIEYLNSKIKIKKSRQYQRALMTSRMRTEIKERDNYTCANCSLSTRDEPNLLLEIDHIIPISKGGMSQLENLQTLCWKCNRSKGSKIL